MNIEKCADALDEVYVNVYQGERLLQTLIDDYLCYDGDTFRENEKAQREVIGNFTSISCILRAICDALYQARLVSEFALNVESPITKAYLRNARKLLEEQENDESGKED